MQASARFPKLQYFLITDLTVAAYLNELARKEQYRIIDGSEPSMKAILFRTFIYSMRARCCCSMFQWYCKLVIHVEDITYTSSSIQNTDQLPHTCWLPQHFAALAQ